MSVSSARDAPVFSAGGRCFTWVEVIEAARARGDWAALERQVGGLVAREHALAAAGGLPGAAQVRAAANDFRYEHHLISADELEDWLRGRDVGLQEWMAEMRRALLEPDAALAAHHAQPQERQVWVHAVCSGKLAAYARRLAEEVAVHLGEQPLGPALDELATLRRERERFCAAQLTESALAAEIANNTVGWTGLDIRSLIHRDETVVREAALCVRQDGRELADVAADAGARLQDTSLLLDDAEPTLRTRLMAAQSGELLGPLATGEDHRLVLVLRRVPPSRDDPALRRRAEDAIIERALAGEVSRQVNWHEYL
jgi:hypothetical protein